MKTLLEPLLHSPMLPLHVRALQTHVTEERRRRQEFREGLSDDQKAEFIEGEIIMHSPAAREHTLGLIHLAKLLHTYVAQHNLGEVYLEKTMIALTRNDYEPDICFFSAKKAARFKRRQHLFPAPDFIVELLSPSTEKRDRGVKMEDYAAHGVQEYWLVDLDHERVEQYLLKSGDYELVAKTASGELRSQAVKGFVCPVRAIFDAKENLRALRIILAAD